MRRLPVFLLIDVSESMIGESLAQLQQAIGTIVSTLRRDPYALETAHLSVIAFAGRARTLQPLTELSVFNPPELPVGGGTALGVALDHLMAEIDRSVTRSRPDRKGDWRPLIFLMTDGHATDDTQGAVDRWNRDYRSRASLVAVSIGGQADHAVLRSLTDDVLVFYDSTPDSFARFAKWISTSVIGQSRSVNAGKDARISLEKEQSGILAPLDERGLEPVDGSRDERFAVFVARCEKSSQPYIVKYVRLDAIAGGRSLFELQTVLQVSNTYFDLSDPELSSLRLSSQQLMGQPSCPYCSAPWGMAFCGNCGGIHCADDATLHRCPWCGEVSQYEVTEGSIDYRRGQG